jgi:hypothetical protein
VRAVKTLALAIALLVACKGESSDRVAFQVEFDGPLSSQQLEQARQLVARRVRPFGIVRLVGEHVVVEVELANALDVPPMIMPGSATLDLRVEDPSSEYMRALARHVKGDAQLAKLDVGAITDVTDHYLMAMDGVEYVNEKFANRVRCEKKNRIVGTGFPCWVTGKLKLEAALHGDEDLFVEPLDASLAVPADREILLEEQSVERHRSLWRTRFVKRDRIALDARAIEAVSIESPAKPTDGSVMRVLVTGEVARQLSTARDAGRLLLVADESTRIVDLDLASRELVIPATLDEAVRFDYAFELARLPARVVDVTPRS